MFKLLKRFFLDSSEKHFLSTANLFYKTNFPNSICSGCHNLNVMFQVPSDYYYTALFFSAKLNLIKNNPAKFFGLWSNTILSSPAGESFQLLRHVLRKVLNLTDRHKWSKLQNIPEFVNTYTFSVGAFNSLSNLSKAYKIWKSLETKQDVLDIYVGSILIGDLIYDSYIRYRVCATIRIADPFLLCIIWNFLDALMASRKIFLKHDIDIYVSSYSSYLSGIPVRVALQLNIDVHTAGSLQPQFKRLSFEDFTHVPAHWLYNSLFKNVVDKPAALAAADAILRRKFKGEEVTSTFYMKKSAYFDSSVQLPVNIDGVIFLHDFLDNPHCYRFLLFEDYIEWLSFTFELIIEHNLNIAVKPHPNQSNESSLVCIKLADKYPQITWLDSNISNKVIFDSSIRVGISAFGTVLHELAYYGIPAIAAGDHPHIAFNIVATPSTREEYAHFIINYRKLTVPSDAKEEILKFYYMHVISKQIKSSIPINDYDYREISKSNDSRALENFSIKYSMSYTNSHVK